MKDSRLVVRTNAQEKQIIKDRAKEKGMSISDYIKHILFDINPDLEQEDDYVYIASIGSKHNYVTFGTVYFNHFLLREIATHLYPENKEEMINMALEKATEKINKMGYSKYLKTDKAKATDA